MGPESGTNLSQAARSLGIDPARLLFAAHLDSIDDHLSRLSLADLYLDTVPYNAHTTATEALWVGVPVLTCVGALFAGRVAASLLDACGLQQLICHDLPGYRSMALQIARSADLRHELKTKLAAEIPAGRAFDTRRYAANFDRLLAGLQRRA
jgi:predicted O-linked N-acetylglucosamine transferase (SPINDLY family)